MTPIARIRMSRLNAMGAHGDDVFMRDEAVRGPNRLPTRLPSDTVKKADTLVAC
jgi:hypothetical protein